jgi:hypothetical protein
MVALKRIILAALVGVLVSGPAWGETVKLGDLRERGGVHYKKFTDIPFSGTVTGLSHGKLKNGKKEGPWVEYNVDGTLNKEWSGTFKVIKKGK